MEKRNPFASQTMTIPNSRCRSAMPAGLALGVGSGDASGLAAAR
jgi:hypothetical protein